jgi:hypothetical protein
VIVTFFVVSKTSAIKLCSLALIIFIDSKEPHASLAFRNLLFTFSFPANTSHACRTRRGALWQAPGRALGQATHQPGDRI